MADDQKGSSKKKILSSTNSNIPSQIFNVNYLTGTSKEPRQLVAGGDGLKLFNGSVEEWSKPPITIFSIAPNDREGKVFTVTSIHQHHFETDDPLVMQKLRHIMNVTCPNSSLSSALQAVGVSSSGLVRPIASSSSSSSSTPTNSPSDFKGSGRKAGLRARANDEGLSPKSCPSVSIDDFELLHVVGKGSFGKVFQVKKKSDGKIYALKILRKVDLYTKKQIEHTLTERKILASIHHAFMPRLHYAFQTETKLYMVMDFANGGEIFYHLRRAGRFPEVLAIFYAAEVVSVIDHLHKHSIIYRDLKPENVLLDTEGHLKITDFGLSKIGITSIGGESGGVGTYTFCGTPEYLAPEILQGIAHGKAVDWWSAGILFYEMITGMPPFYSSNRNDMYQNIMKAPLMIPEVVSSNAQDFIKKMLTKKPEERLGSGAGEGAEVKGHPLFKNIDWDLLERRCIPPPFKPKFKDGVMDINNIDKQFLEMELIDTPIPPLDPSIADLINKQFIGFEYNKEMDVNRPPSPSSVIHRAPVPSSNLASSISTIPVTPVNRENKASEHPLLQPPSSDRSSRQNDISSTSGPSPNIKSKHNPK